MQIHVLIWWWCGASWPCWPCSPCSPWWPCWWCCPEVELNIVTMVTMLMLTVLTMLTMLMMVRSTTSWPQVESSRINNSAERQSSDTAILRPSQCFHSASSIFSFAFHPDPLNVFTQPFLMFSLRPSSCFHPAPLNVFTQPLFMFSLRPSTCS